MSLPAKLTHPWFEACFITNALADGSYRQGHPVIDGAQGILFWCPCGFGKPQYPMDGARPHACLVVFANPRGVVVAPANFGPTARDDTSHPRWAMIGTGLNDLTLSPSIDVGKPSCWHGYIRGGIVV